MKKSHLILLSLVGLFFVGSWIHHWWTGRGLITLDVKDAPITKVLREMQRQSGFPVLARTNLNEKVTVQFQRVTIEKALDVVSDQTEGRWQKVLLVARDKPALRKVESQVAEKGPPFVITGMDFISDSLDPEKLRKGTVKPLAGSHPLQEAALAIAVRSATPVVVQEGLNPFVKASATSYPGIAPAIGDLAHAASARWEVAYHFRAGGRGFGGGGGRGEGSGHDHRGGGEGGGGGDGRGFRIFGGGDEGNTNNPFATQTALLTPEQQAAMEKGRAEMRQRMAEFAAMTPAQRAQRMADMMDGGGSPARQQRSQQRALQRIMNSTPEQQVKMNQRFEQRLQRIQKQMQQNTAPTSTPKPQGGK
ncbi:MAG: hypothetical protein ACOYMV_04280 [Verrucomicrobiia bacterium]